MVDQRAVVLAITVYLSIALRGTRLKTKQRWPIDELFSTATTDPHYQELEHVLEDLLPSNHRFEALRPAIDELLANDPCSAEHPLADKTTCHSMRLRRRTGNGNYKETSLDEGLGFDAPVVTYPVTAPVTSLPAASAPVRASLPRRGGSFFQRWTADEDDQLKQLVAKIGTTNWPTVAARFRGRSVQQCREHWHRCLAPQKNKGKWTPEEDREILKRVAEIGPKWAQISRQYMPDRIDNEIRTRWAAISSKKPRLRNERQVWTAGEDEQLSRAVAERGAENWLAIAAHMRNRDHGQCYRRWHNHLSPHLTKSEWTPEEDQQLLNGVEELGTTWSQIRKHYIRNRNDNDIFRRWKLLIKKA